MNMSYVLSLFGESSVRRGRSALLAMLSQLFLFSVGSTAVGADGADGIDEEAPRIDYAWQGSGSLISLASDELVGFGFTHDEIHIGTHSSKSPAVFFQWQVDLRDGNAVTIDSSFAATATIVYGRWDTRAYDRAFKYVTLPFTIIPEKDGYEVYDGDYYVAAVLFDEVPTKPEMVSIATVGSEAFAGAYPQSEKSERFLVDGKQWAGVSSLIAFDSVERKNYGLTHDECRMAVDSEFEGQVAFLQWQFDQQDGEVLLLESRLALRSAKVTIGPWSDRAHDITLDVQSFPIRIDPSKLGFSPEDGDFYVIKVETNSIDSAASTNRNGRTTTVTARLVPLEE